MSCVVGCDLASGFTDLADSYTNPDAALLDSPGRKLASGQFHNLLVDGSVQEGGYVVALRKDDDLLETAIIPYLEGKPCFVKPATGVARISSRVDVDLPGVLAVQQDADEYGRGKVSFVNFECEEIFDELEDSRIPQLLFPANDPRGVLALDKTNELYLVDLRKKQLVAISSGVSLARSFESRLWTVENGQLIIRDSDFEEIARMGENVTEYVYAGGESIEVVFIDDNGLQAWHADTGISPISSNGCSPMPWGGDAIAYFDPCEARKLNIYASGKLLGVDNESIHLEGPSGVGALSTSLSTWGRTGSNSKLAFILSRGAQDVGALAFVDIPPSPKIDEDEDEDAERPTLTLDPVILADENATIRSGHIYLDWNNDRGTLTQYKYDDDDDEKVTGLQTIAHGVAQIHASSPYSDGGLLTDFDEKTGTLQILTAGDDETSTFTLAENVPIQVQTTEVDTSRIAFVGESKDGTRGTLFLTDEKNGRKKSPRDIDTNVLINTIRFLAQPRAVAYLRSAPDSDFAELRVWLIDSELHMTIHPRVSEYRTVPWPADGILYAVPSGDDKGLWFSKAR